MGVPTATELFRETHHRTYLLMPAMMGIASGSGPMGRLRGLHPSYTVTARYDSNQESLV